MADEDLASQEAADGVVVEDAALANEEQDDTPEPIATLAAEMGWKPRDQWQGEADAWKPAADFIKAGREIQQTTARELRSVREQIERLGGVTETIIADKVAERDAYWRTQFNQAVEDGDTEKASALLDRRPSAQPAKNGADPTVQTWVSRNEWFTKEPLAASVARQVSDQLAKDGYDTAAQLEAAEKEVKRRFPELFPKPAKQAPGVQTAASRNAGASNRVKGFADMPLASQQVALDYEKRLGVPKETTAKSYWADQEGVKR